MASGKMLGGDGSREEHRWTESKVYSRKPHNKSSIRKSGNPPLHSAADDVNSSHHPSSPPAALPAPSAVSDDASSLNRPLQALVHRNQPNRHHQFPRKTTINLASRSREELRDIRQNLTAELEVIRATVRKIEAREHQAACASASLAPAAGYTLSQLSASEPNTSSIPAKKTALNSEVASCRPQASVSVMPGESSLNDGAEKEKRTPKANHYYRNSEFLLGKDKLPPFEPHGHKKHKVNESKAVVKGERDQIALTNAFNSCKDLLSKLMKHKHGWIFNVAVDVKKLNIPDYHSIIKHPMDLGTIRSRLHKNWYRTPEEFAEDVRLTFKNAMTYNPKGQDVHHMAEQLLNMFEEKWPAIEGEFSNVSYKSPKAKKVPLDLRTQERSDSTANLAPAETNTRMVSNAPQVGRPLPSKKPKARDPDKRDMTFEEKQRLSNNLQNLPPEKLENIVQIIKKRTSSLNQHDDEIEVDIDSVDVETLWELDRFVTNYKKSLSKNKRKEKLAILAKAGVESNDNETMREVIPGSVAVGEHGEGTIVLDEKEVSSGSRIKEEKRRGNASKSSSSNSSSSGSGSSSSDSDSESSSAYGSDGALSPRT